jgi:hypothetical protein
VFELLERAPQADVFEVLGIGDERHGRFLSVGFYCSGMCWRGGEALYSKAGGSSQLFALDARNSAVMPF